MNSIKTKTTQRATNKTTADAMRVHTDLKKYVPEEAREDVWDEVWFATNIAIHLSTWEVVSDATFEITGYDHNQ